MRCARSSCIIEFYESYGFNASPPAATVISAACYLLHAFIREPRIRARKLCRGEFAQNLRLGYAPDGRSNLHKANATVAASRDEKSKNRRAAFASLSLSLSRVRNSPRFVKTAPCAA